MNLAVSNISWPIEADEQMYGFLVDREIHGLEVAPTKWYPENPYDYGDDAHKYVEEIKKKYDLNVISIQSIWYGCKENIFENDRSFQKLLCYTEKALNFAKDIGCSNLVFGSPYNRNGGRDNMDKAIDFFSKIGTLAAERQIVFAIEPNPLIYNTDFLNDTMETVTFLRNVSNSGLGLNLDLGAMIENDESIDVIYNVEKYIRHVHISEPYLKPLKQRIFFERAASALRDLKYQGYVSLEMTIPRNINCLKESIDYMINIFGG